MGKSATSFVARSFHFEFISCMKMIESCVQTKKHMYVILFSSGRHHNDDVILEEAPRLTSLSWGGGFFSLQISF